MADETTDAELTAELVADGKVPRTPAVSPDGRWVSYAVAPTGRTGKHPRSALWLAPTDGSRAPRALTPGTAGDTCPRWAADSAAIFFLSDRPVPGEPQLHMLDPATHGVRTLTTWRGGVVAHRPLADAGRVAVLARDEPTGRDEDTAWAERTTPARLRVLDTGTGEIVTPAVLGDRHVVDVVQRPGGGPLAVLTWSTPELDPGSLNAELHLVDLGTGTRRDLGPVPVEATDLVWWRADTDWRLAYLATTPPGLVGGTALFDVALDTGARHNVTAGMPACPAALAQVDGSTPLVLVADGLDTAIHRLDPEGHRLVEVARLDGLATSLTADARGAVVAVIRSTPERPPDVAAGPPHGPLRQVSDTRPELRRVRLGSQERLRYHADDGLSLDGLLVLPPGRSRRDGPFPLVTLVHGGPYDRHADSLMLDWFPSGQWLAAAGYAVFQPNPRGGKGHGHEFAAQAAGAVGLGEWTDLMTGIDLLVDDGVADPDRLGIGGWSHGGFVAAWAVGQTHRFKAALMGAGICDWGMLAATGECGQLEAALGGSTGWEGPGPHPHDRLSPISFASRIRTPVLIVHGAEDTNVPVSQAEFFHRALRRFGVEHDYVVYPREGHSIRERGHQLDLLRRTRAWFDRWLRG